MLYKDHVVSTRTHRQVRTRGKGITDQAFAVTQIRNDEKMKKVTHLHSPGLFQVGKLQKEKIITQLRSLVPGLTDEHIAH